MTISEILDGLDFSCENSSNIEITSLSNDSRMVDNNTMFIATSGYVEDCHPYIDSAYTNGCRVFLADSKKIGSFVQKYSDGYFYLVDDLKFALSMVAKNFYHDPSSKFKLIGITGTNGKTTTATVIFSVLRSMGLSVGMIGTIEHRINNTVIPADNTTPDILVLNKLLADMVDAGVDYAVMEVSSHALELGRVIGVSFEIVAFTNLTQDHLDFHKDMDNYLQAKLKLFDLLAENKSGKKIALVNKDIEVFFTIKKRCDEDKITLKSFSIKDYTADYYAYITKLLPFQTTFELCNTTLILSMIGEPNVYNFTLATAIMIELGFSIDDFKDRLSDIHVRGRMQSVKGTGDIAVIIDYAHTPDALKNLLQSLSRVATKDSRLITVFGAGGDRDHGKRPKMGAIAAKLSDIVVVTSDNPRTEKPSAIIADIVEGIKPGRPDLLDIYIEPDRAAAIAMALSIAKPHDIVAIAGKGHEDYQIIGKTKIHFSDYEQVQQSRNSIHYE